MGFDSQRSEGPTQYKDFVRVTKTLVRWVYNKKIPTIVVAGSSAQPSAYIFKQVWQKVYPKEAMPKFYALGMQPNIYKFWLKPLPDGALNSMWDNHVIKKMPSLKERLGRPILIFDEVIHSGSTMGNVSRMLELVGAGKILTATFVKLSSGIRVDFVGNLRNEPMPRYKLRRKALHEGEEHLKKAYSQERSLLRSAVNKYCKPRMHA